MLRDLELYTATEVDQIKTVIQDLFRSTCILQMSCNPENLVFSDNARYKMCMKYREFIADYLEVLDCELVHDTSEHLFRLIGKGAMVEKMSLATTRLVILLKLIYHEKIMGEGLNATVTTLSEIRQMGMDTQLLTRKLTDSEWSEALNLMRTHQMIALPCAIGNLEDHTRIYIYNTVNIYCNTASLGQLVEDYAMTGEVGAEQVELDTEEGADETTEENI